MATNIGVGDFFEKHPGVLTVVQVIEVILALMVSMIVCWIIWVVLQGVFRKKK